MDHYYSIYHRESGMDLTFIMDLTGKDAQDVLLKFQNEYGDNYGKVVVLPMMFKSQSYSLELTK